VDATYVSIVRLLKLVGGIPYDGKGMGTEDNEY
jgi:hypothetical protein